MISYSMRRKNRIECSFCGKESNLKKEDISQYAGIHEVIKLLPEWTIFDIGIENKKERYFFICGDPKCRELFDKNYHNMILDLLNTSKMQKERSAP